MAEEGNGDVGGDAGRPGPRGLVERKRGSRRSLWASRGSKGGPVAVVAANGGVGCARVWRGREQRRGGRSTGGSERGPGGGVALRETSRGRRRQPGREELASSAEDDREEGGGGLGQLAGLPAGPARWAAQ